jgi:hypothetical protein
VRLRGTSDGGVAARLCGPALAHWRPVYAKCTAPSASMRRARRPDEAGRDTSPSGEMCELRLAEPGVLMRCAKHKALDTVT